MKKCHITFHLPCGMKAGTHHEFCDSWDSFCPDHGRVQEIYNSKDKSVFTEARECGVCFDGIKPIKSMTTLQQKRYLWSPCCNKWWVKYLLNFWIKVLMDNLPTWRFHKECIQKLATSSGYFFKCPMCNNKEEFDKEMKKFGIYVPEQDAAWEREGNIFDGIYERKFENFITIFDKCTLKQFRFYFRPWNLWCRKLPLPWWSYFRRRLDNLGNCKKV